MDSGKKRSSNFELLRILAMLMIIMFHIVPAYCKYSAYRYCCYIDLSVLRTEVQGIGGWT